MLTRVNTVREKASRLLCRDNNAAFEELLGKNNSVAVHHEIFQLLAVEIFKVRNDLMPDILKEVFEFKYFAYNLGPDANTFLLQKIRTN